MATCTVPKKPRKAKQKKRQTSWTREELIAYYANPDHKLLGFKNSKTVKGEKRGYRTAILYLTPFTLSGLGNLCGSASDVCPDLCIHFTGRNRMPTQQWHKLRKTYYWFVCREEFLAQLRREIATHVAYCLKRGLTPCFRPNGTSDILWENFIPDIFTAYPQLIVYDYTKHEKRMTKSRPGNYHLTFSRSDKPGSEDIARKVLASGGNVAVVFEDADFPNSYLGYRCESGDADDLTFLHEPGTIIALYAKGPAKKDTRGFVVRGYERVKRS